MVLPDGWKCLCYGENDVRVKDPVSYELEPGCEGRLESGIGCSIYLNRIGGPPKQPRLNRGYPDCCLDCQWYGITELEHADS